MPTGFAVGRQYHSLQECAVNLQYCCSIMRRDHPLGCFTRRALASWETQSPFLNSCRAPKEQKSLQRSSIEVQDKTV